MGSNGSDELSQLTNILLLDPDKESIGLEITAIQSIYGEQNVHLWRSSSDTSNPHLKVQYEVATNILSSEEISVRILVTLPPSYPSTSPPQLQLLSKYIGPFKVDSTLFGSILRTYISHDGVPWCPGNVCVFDGMQYTVDRCASWYEQALSGKTVGEMLRMEARDNAPVAPLTPPALEYKQAVDSEETSHNIADSIVVHEAEPIIDRKSVFIGRACHIESPSQISAILAQLMLDRRIARAAHPVINAWRCKTQGILYQDNDDDGETAAGARLAHLLQILELDNVLVVVTRYFGGIHLGPDRFKHINQAARNALELGGFLDDVKETKRHGRGKKKA